MPVVLGVVWGLAGCGGGGNDGDDQECLLHLTLSGALEQDLQWGDPEGCGGSSTADSFTAAFGIVATDLHIQIQVQDTGPGDTGQQAASRVHIAHQDDRVWETPAGACRVDVTTNRTLRTSQLGTTWLVAGAGNCDQPAAPVPDDGSAPLGLSAFDFQTAILWLD